MATTVKEIAKAKKPKSSKGATSPKINMELVYQKNRWGSSLPMIDDAIEEKMLELAKEVAKQKRLSHEHENEINPKLLSEVNEKGEIDNLVHGTLTTTCNCKSLYPNHSYSFDACIHDANNNPVDQFDIKITFHHDCEKRRSVVKLRKKQIAVDEQFENVKDILGTDHPLVEELFDSQSLVEDHFGELEAFVEEVGDEYVSPRKREEFEELLEEIDLYLGEYEILLNQAQDQLDEDEDEAEVEA